MIVSCTIKMRDSIAFHDYTVRDTNKVNGLNPNRMLAPKLKTCQVTITQKNPHDSFSQRRFAT
jgi:hypothetical protein